MKWVTNCIIVQLVIKLRVINAYYNQNIPYVYRRDSQKQICLSHRRDVKGETGRVFHVNRRYVTGNEEHYLPRSLMVVRIIIYP